ncbi:MAG: GGDEF domain-containing protein [Rhodospirillales bacterium]|nr:GGDEF domain-containing protein [Rhodospirillales bacterium]
MNSLVPARSLEIPVHSKREGPVSKVGRLVHSLGLFCNIPDNDEALVDPTPETAKENAKAAKLLIAHLQDRIAELELLAETDELTGLPNRRGFDNLLQRVLSGVSRYDEQGVLIYIDLDAFKPINDSCGHAAGDEVLRQVATLLRDGIRDTDFAGRMGGDEFAVLLTRTNWENGFKRARRIEKQLNNSIVHWHGRMIAISASFGLQGYGAKEDGLDLLARADEAMYTTKRLRTNLGTNDRDGPRVAL